MKKYLKIPGTNPGNKSRKKSWEKNPGKKYRKKIPGKNPGKSSKRIT